MTRKAAAVVVVGLLIAVVSGCGPGTKQVTIANGWPRPWSLHVVTRGANGAPDRVVWKNEDDVAHTVSFSTSPFGSAAQRFTIQPHSSSQVFLILEKASRGQYLYDVNPTPFQEAQADSGPGPVVIVDE